MFIMSHTSYLKETVKMLMSLGPCKYFCILMSLSFKSTRCNYITLITVKSLDFMDVCYSHTRTDTDPSKIPRALGCDCPCHTVQVRV